MRPRSAVLTEVPPQVADFVELAAAALVPAHQELDAAAGVGVGKAHPHVGSLFRVVGLDLRYLEFVERQALRRLNCNILRVAGRARHLNRLYYCWGVLVAVVSLYKGHNLAVDYVEIGLEVENRFEIFSLFARHYIVLTRESRPGLPRGDFNCVRFEARESCFSQSFLATGANKRLAGLVDHGRSPRLVFCIHTYEFCTFVL